MENQIQVRKQTAITVRQRDRQFTLKDLDSNQIYLRSDEQKIWDARQVGIAISDMSEEESSLSTTGIIFNVSVICGCELPTHEAHINALEKEFLIFINDFGYKELTAEEILTAFRMNANFQLEEHIETYGKVFNIDFASKVLKQYRGKRYSLDLKLSDVHYEIEVKKVLNEEADKRRKQIIEQFDKYIKDENTELDLKNCYMQLNDDGGFANPNLYFRFMDEVRSVNRRGETSLKDTLSKYSQSLNDSFSAQARAVKYLFENMKRQNRLKIYNDDMKLLHPGFLIPEPIEEPKELDY